MEKLKKFIGASLAIGLLALSTLHPVIATATEAANKFPSSQGGLKHENLNFQGVKTKRLTLTATSALLVNGPGFLDAICPMGGTLGKYSGAFDTGGQQVAGSIFVAANNGYKISPHVYTNTDTTSSNANKGCWVPPAPVKFVTGLYGGQNDAGHETLFFVHCSDGSNPCEI